MRGFFLCRSWLQNPNSCCLLGIRSISFQIFCLFSWSNVC
jgi:hypothetical protein